MEINSGGMSFQFQPETPSGQVVGASGAAPRLGITGGQTRSGVQRFQEAQSLGNSELPDFLASAFAPKLEAAKQQKFWAGFAAARSGKTQQEIADETPWYAGIFGPTTFELGAQKFGVDKAMADVDNKFTQDMHRLRELPPDEIGNELNTIATSLLTGNVFTDALIQKGLMERGGPMLDAHAKARYEWQQTELSRARNEAWVSQSGAYNTAAIAAARLGREHPGQAETAEQRAERSRILLEGFAMGDGENPEAYQRDLGNFVVAAAENGHWNTLNLLEDTDAYSMLPPERRDALMAKVEQARGKFRNNLAATPELYEPLVMLNVRTSQGMNSAEDTVMAMGEINELYSALTGDRKPLFNLNDTVRGAETAMTAMYNAYEQSYKAANADRKAATTEALKAEAEARQAASVATAVQTGSAGRLLGAGAKREEIETAFAVALGNSDPNTPWIPEGLARIAVTNYATAVSGREPFVSERVKAMLRGQVESASGESWTPGFEAAYQNWKSMYYHEVDLGNGKVDRVSGQGTARQYYGDDLHERMEAYDRSRRGQNPLEAEFAYKQNFGTVSTSQLGTIRVTSDRIGTNEQWDEMRTVLKDSGPSLLAFGMDDLGRSGFNATLNAMSASYARIRRDPSISVEDAAAAALQEITANGWETAGKYAWQNSKGQQPLHAAVSMSKEVFEDHFDTLVSDRLKRAGVALDASTSVSIIRTNDAADAAGDSDDPVVNPRMLVMAMRDGRPVTIAITGEDIKEVARRERARVRDRQAAFQNAGPVIPRGSKL